MDEIEIYEPNLKGKLKYIAQFQEPIEIWVNDKLIYKSEVKTATCPKCNGEMVFKEAKGHWPSYYECSSCGWKDQQPHLSVEV